jgi:glycosyltransferase involved in cell wall biosynthesis
MTEIHKPPEIVVYVSAFYEYEGSKPIHEQFSKFMPLLQNTAKWVIFSDTSEIQTLLQGFSNCCVQIVPRADFYSFGSNDDDVLPDRANPSKDTRQYLQLSCAKPEMLQRASQILAADAYIWVSNDILHLSKHHATFIENLYTIHLSATSKKILIPGCIQQNSIVFETIFSSPIWRFCTNIFVVPKDCVDEFATNFKEQLEICRKIKKITWEFNLLTIVEQQLPNLFQWYLADHNDTIVNPPRPAKDRRVILISMIKNESRIIKRLIGSVLGFVDAICISDTGSTDTTVQLLEEYYPTLSIPCKTYHHEWKHFGHNRSLSFEAAVDFCKSLGWDPQNTYGVLLDGDMELRVMPGFSKDELKSIGYKIIQRSGTLEYYNTRFVKLSHPWKCVGVTHEYWDGGNTDTLTPDKVFIQDIGDGGCKSDKFERDVRLLEQGLLDSPNNPRYLFYLAQSYKDSKQIDKSIEYYKKRIEAGGWYEEIWYSMYTLMKLYAEKKMFADMEYWGLKAYEYRKERSENLLYLCRFFRDARQYFKAWHYWTLGSVIKKPDDLLFIETECYSKSFEYERAILHDYVFPEKKRETLVHALNYFNKWDEYWCYMNFEWFVQPIPSKVRKFAFPRIGDFGPTSTCLCRMPDGTYTVNVRYVNYRIEPTGRYIMCQDGRWDYNNAVRTENFVCLMDKDFSIYSPLTKMDMLDPVPHQSHIQGLEDVRIFLRDGKLWYTATTKNYSYDGNIRQHLGEYNVDTHRFENSISLKPPMPTDCEKNWIPYKGNKFIYGWRPFRIGSIGADNALKIETSQDTVPMLQHMRGSSTLVEEDGFAWGITHCVIYKQPRKYYHMVIKIDLATDKIVGYTHPFFFVKNAIEYCLGFEKRGDIFYAFVSQNDSDPIFVEFKDKDLVWQKIE